MRDIESFFCCFLSLDGSRLLSCHFGNRICAVLPLWWKLKRFSHGKLVSGRPASQIRHKPPGVCLLQRTMDFTANQSPILFSYINNVTLSLRRKANSLPILYSMSCTRVYWYPAKPGLLPNSRRASPPLFIVVNSMFSPLIQPSGSQPCRCPRPPRRLVPGCASGAGCAGSWGWRRGTRRPSRRP